MAGDGMQLKRSFSIKLYIFNKGAKDIYYFEKSFEMKPEDPQ